MATRELSTMYLQHNYFIDWITNKVFQQNTRYLSKAKYQGKAYLNLFYTQYLDLMRFRHETRLVNISNKRA